MKSAVEWLLENLISEPYSETDFEHNEKCWDNAEKMEKQQIEEAYSNGRVDEQFKGTGASFYLTKSEQYYNKTFKDKL
jgi:hypothetical protein